MWVLVAAKEFRNHRQCTTTTSLLSTRFPHQREHFARLQSFQKLWPKIATLVIARLLIVSFVLLPFQDKNLGNCNQLFLPPTLDWLPPTSQPALLCILPRTNLFVISQGLCGNIFGTLDRCSSIQGLQILSLIQPPPLHSHCQHRRCKDRFCCRFSGTCRFEEQRLSPDNQQPYCCRCWKVMMAKMRLMMRMIITLKAYDHEWK